MVKAKSKASKAAPAVARAAARAPVGAAAGAALSAAPGLAPGAALGIDVGGTGVKAAVVDVATGTLLSRRVRLNTPKPATPDAVAATVASLVEMIGAQFELAADLPVGCGLPAPIKDGRLMTAANIDKHWIGLSAEDLIGGVLGRRVYAINDADAAGLAEMRVGAGRDCHGTALMLTVGTGIGSGLFVDQRLVPNTEFGHLEFRGHAAETRISGASRERRHLRWRAWADEFNDYLARVERYFWPDLIILGGGLSKELAKYQKWLKSRAPIVPAKYLNTSGIVGAAMYASDRARAEGTARPATRVRAVKPATQARAATRARTAAR